MSSKILLIPWDDIDLYFLLKAMLNHIGHEIVSFDVPLNKSEIGQIENVCEEYQPNVLISYINYLDEYHDFMLCKMLKSNPNFKDVGLIYLFKRVEHSIYWTRPKDSCFADIYLPIPFTKEELEEAIQEIIDKKSI